MFPARTLLLEASDLVSTPDWTETMLLAFEKYTAKTPTRIQNSQGSQRRELPKGEFCLRNFSMFLINLCAHL